jgi:hypothetical protein
MKLPDDSLGLAAATVGRLAEAIVVLTNKQKAKYMRLSAAPAAKRANKGDYVISMGAKEQVVAVVKFQESIERPATDEGE